MSTAIGACGRLQPSRGLVDTDSEDWLGALIEAASVSEVETLLQAKVIAPDFLELGELGWQILLSKNSGTVRVGASRFRRSPCRYSPALSDAIIERAHELRQ